jgi:hypothetical protein
MALTLATKNTTIGTMAFFPQQVQEAYDDVMKDTDLAYMTDDQKEVYALAL